MAVNLVSTRNNWILWLVRPFNLFGASLWYSWYDSELAEELFGVRMTDALFIEQQPGVVRQYRTKDEAKRFHSGIERLVSENPNRCLQYCKQAELLNNTTRKLLKSSKYSLVLSDAVKYFINLGLLGAALPNYTLQSLDKLKIRNTKLKQTAEKLRLVSLYPQFYNKIITPLIHKELQRQGSGNSKNLLDVVTWPQLKNRQIENLPDKLRQAKDRHFVYQVIKGKGKVSWVTNTSDIINQIEHSRMASFSHGLEIRGQTAYPGYVTGKARLVLSLQKGNRRFKKGDILVTINSNPSLMPYIKKCSAIVADEGGVMSHAAIISRELSKPCIIGTKIATSIIQEGATVKVNATRGVITINK